MKEVIVKTQKELDSLDLNEELKVIIQSEEEEQLEIKATGKDWYTILDRFSYVNKIRGSSQVNVMRGSSQVNEMWENSQVNVMWESSQVNKMWESSKVNVMRGSSQVNEMWENSQVNVMWESSQVNEMWENSQVNVMRGSSQVNEMRGSSQVNVMRESSQVNVMRESSQVNEMRGSSQVFLYGFAMVCIAYSGTITGFNNNIVRYINNSYIKIIGSVNEIQLDTLKPNIESFSKHFPVKENGNKTIWYKAVRNIDGKLVANYDRKFEYKIGETVKEKVEYEENESCGAGIHISGKSWALSFGNDWDNMEIIELEVDKKDIFVSTDTDGKVRCSKAKVLRIVPKEEYYV